MLLEAVWVQLLLTLNYVSSLNCYFRGTVGLTDMTVVDFFCKSFQYYIMIKI